jgi:hypothetical protein
MRRPRAELAGMDINGHHLLQLLQILIISQAPLIISSRRLSYLKLNLNYVYQQPCVCMEVSARGSQTSSAEVKPAVG